MPNFSHHSVIEQLLTALTDRWRMKLTLLTVIGETDSWPSLDRLCFSRRPTVFPIFSVGFLSRNYPARVGPRFLQTSLTPSHWPGPIFSRTYCRPVYESSVVKLSNVFSGNTLLRPRKARRRIRPPLLRPSSSCLSLYLSLSFSLHTKVQSRVKSACATSIPRRLASHVTLAAWLIASLADPSSHWRPVALSHSLEITVTVPTLSLRYNQVNRTCFRVHLSLSI